MINFQLNKKVVALFSAVAVFGAFTVSSSAALINIDSEMALFGTYGSDGTDLTLVTELTFPAPAVIAAGANDFAFAVGGSATFNTIFIGATAAANGGLGNTIFTFANGGAFTASAINIDFQTETALNLTMQGFWSLDGFDDTLGQLVLTADSLGGLRTFSAAGTVVPVPAAVWLFGSALAALGLTRRRTA